MGNFYFRENIILDQEDPTKKVISRFDRKKNQIKLEINVEPHDFEFSRSSDSKGDWGEKK